VDGGEEPTFTFSTGNKKTVDSIRFEETSQATTKEGDTYTSKYVMKTLKPYINGPAFKCKALFAGTTAKGPTEKTMDLTVYYNCETKTVLGANSLPDGASMNYDFSSDTGDSTVSVTCPADTSVLKYLDEGETATCTKSTGKFDPVRIKGCGKIHIRKFSEVDTIKSWKNIPLASSVCSDSATGTATKAYVEDVLTSNYEGDVCGWEYTAPSCFAAETCTKTISCDYDAEAETLAMTLVVTRTAGEYSTFNLADYKTEHAKFKVPSATTKFQFWDCNKSASKKRSVEEMTETTVIHWERSHINETIYDPVIEDEILEERFTLDQNIAVKADDLETLEKKNFVLLPILAAILLITLILAVVIIVKLNRKKAEALSAKTESFKDPEPAFSGKLQFTEA